MVLPSSAFATLGSAFAAAMASSLAAPVAKEDAIAAAKAEPNVAKALEGKTICKEIYVPGKLVNIAVR